MSTRTSQYNPLLCLSLPTPILLPPKKFVGVSKTKPKTIKEIKSHHHHFGFRLEAMRKSTSTSTAASHPTPHPHPSSTITTTSPKLTEFSLTPPTTTRSLFVNPFKYVVKAFFFMCHTLFFLPPKSHGTKFANHSYNTDVSNPIPVIQQQRNKHHKINNHHHQPQHRQLTIINITISMNHNSNKMALGHQQQQIMRQRIQQLIQQHHLHHPYLLAPLLSHSPTRVTLNDIWRRSND